jgi:hypothetical protein
MSGMSSVAFANIEKSARARTRTNFFMEIDFGWEVPVRNIENLSRNA